MIKKVFLLLIFTFISCGAKKFAQRDITLINERGEEVILKAEFSVTEQEHAYGYMNRKHIPDGTGMLFVYKADEIMAYWMKDTPHPLSIAFITKDGIIKDIYDMEPFDLSSVKSTGYVRYALEVPQGWYKKAGITTGCKLKLDF